MNVCLLLFVLLSFQASQAPGSALSHGRNRKTRGPQPSPTPCESSSDPTNSFLVVPIAQSTFHENELEVGLGTPPQRIILDIDLNHNGFSVISAGADLLMDGVQVPEDEVPWLRGFDYYDELESRTALNSSVPRIFTLGYALAEIELRGHLYSDVLNIGGRDVSRIMFANIIEHELAYVGARVLGLGPSRYSTKYGLLEQLVARNRISSPSFSISTSPRIDAGDPIDPFDVADEEARHSPGQMVLGGIDTRKYSGPLRKLQVLDAPNMSELAGDGDRYWLKLGGINIRPPDSTSERDILILSSLSGIVVIPDTMGPMLALPPEILDEILSYFPDAEPVQKLEEGIYTIECSWKYTQGNLTFHLSALEVSIPYADLVSLPGFLPPPWDEICVFMIQETYEPYGVLGNVFLQHVTMAVNIDEDAVYMATRADCGTHIVPFAQDTIQDWENGACPVGPPSGRADSPQNTPSRSDGEQATITSVSPASGIPSTAVASGGEGEASPPHYQPHTWSPLDAHPSLTSSATRKAMTTATTIRKSNSVDRKPTTHVAPGTTHRPVVFVPVNQVGDRRDDDADVCAGTREG